MRILLDYRPALRERTGVGEFVHELARALSATTDDAADDELTILTTSWADRPSPMARAELPRARWIDRRIPVRALAWSWNRLEWPPVEWLAGPTDVVHAQTPLLIPAAHAAQVVTIHDLHFLSHPDRSEAEIRRDFAPLTHDHARRADQIVVSSQYAASEVQKRLDVPRQKISICPPGAPLWARDVAQARSQRRSGSCILFVGTLEPRKNIRGLLRAYAHLRQRRSDAPPLILAGKVSTATERELAQVQTNGLSETVKMPGYVSDDERQRLYREACMLVLPSFEEGFGLPVLEAMACGVPVIVSNRGSLPEVAGVAASPIDPDDPDALATEMERLLDPDAAQVAAGHGLDQAACYTWDACARAAREAYRAAISVRAARRS